MCCTAQRSNQVRMDNFLSMAEGADSIDSMISDKSTRIDRPQSGSLRPTSSLVFREINQKRDGMLSEAEFLHYLERKKVIVDRPVAKKIFQMFDHSETGYLTQIEFARICPSDGNFTRAVEVCIQRLKTQEKERKKKKKTKKKTKKRAMLEDEVKEDRQSNQVAAIKEPARLGRNYHPKQTFVHNDSDEDKRAIRQASDRLLAEERDWSLSPPSEPELRELYARSTLRTSLNTARHPGKQLSVRSSISERSDTAVQVKGYDGSNDEDFEGSFDSLPGGLPEDKAPVQTPWNKPNALSSPATADDTRTQTPKSDQLVVWGRDSRHDYGSERRAEPQFPKSHGTSNMSAPLALARSPDTTPPAVDEEPEELWLYLDFGPLEESSVQRILSDRDVEHLREQIAKEKNTPVGPIRIRFKGRVLSNEHTLDELGLGHRSKLRVDLAGGAPLDEANRVFTKYIQGKALPRTSIDSRDCEAYLLHTRQSKSAAGAIKRGMQQRGWAFQTPELGKVTTADIKSVSSALSRCHLFLLFVTRDVATDPWALLQILIARHHQKPFSVVFETDLKAGGLTSQASLENVLGQLLTQASFRDSVAWSNSVYQQLEIFEHLSSTIARIKRKAYSPSQASTASMKNPFKFDAASLTFVSPLQIGHTSAHYHHNAISLPPPSHLGYMNHSRAMTPPKAGSDRLPSLTSSLLPTMPSRGVSADNEEKTPQRPNFTPTSNRITTYRALLRKGRNVTRDDMKHYLSKEGVALTSDELDELFSTIAKKRKDVITVSDFIQYCPPKGGFAEKVWEKYRKDEPLTRTTIHEPDNEPEPDDEPDTAVL